MILDAYIIMCNLYFLFNAHIAYRYCNAPPSEDNFFDSLLLDFCEKHSQALCDRPEWLRIQCCIDGYYYSWCYLFLIYLSITNTWYKYKKFILFNLGTYVYSLVFYYIMLYTYHKPPSYDLEWYASEFPYHSVLLLVLYKTWNATPISKNYKNYKSI